MTKHWADANPAIHFSVMHPGWADTPGIVQHDFTTTPPPLYPQICVILTFWGGRGTCLLSATDLLNRSVCGGTPNQFWPFFSCFNVDASVPPDDGWEAAHCWTRSRHRGVVGPVQSSRHDSQRPVLPRSAVTVPPPLVSSTVNPWQTLYCRPSACFHPLALGLDTQLWRRHGEFHKSAGCSGQSYPVTSWCATRTQWTNRPLQD